MWTVSVAVIALLLVSSSAELELLGEWDLDFGFNKVGGLSGSTYDPDSNLFYLVPDQDAPRAVIYKAEVEFSQGQGIAAIKMFEEIRLPIPLHTSHRFYDIEAITYADGTLYYANEYLEEGSPSIRQTRTDGTWIRSLYTPEHHRVRVVDGSQVRGVSPNRAYHGLAMLPGGRLMVAPASALVQDETSSGFGPIRITAYDVSDASDNLKPFYEYVYQPDDAPEGWVSLGLRGMTGVPGENRFVVLESFANEDESEFFSRLYLVDIENFEASSVLATESLIEADYVPLQKTLVQQLDAESLGVVHVDKLDRITFGPVYQGYRILTVGSDNDFKALPRRTQTFAFAYKP